MKAGICQARQRRPSRMTPTICAGSWRPLAGCALTSGTWSRCAFGRDWTTPRRASARRSGRDGPLPAVPDTQEGAERPESNAGDSRKRTDDLSAQPHHAATPGSHSGSAVGARAIRDAAPGLWPACGTAPM